LDIKRRRRSLLNDLRRTRNAVVEAPGDIGGAFREQRPDNEVVVEDNGPRNRSRRSR
jgi:hypothetical protein